MRKPQKNDNSGERGGALIIALILSAALAIMATSMLTVSLTDRTIASNDAESANAFNVAEAGIDHAIAELHDADADALLAGGGVLFANKTLGAGQYSVTIENNVGPRFPTGAIPADSGGASADTDGYLVVTSTGRFNEAERAIEVILEKTAGGSPTGPFQWAAFGVNKVKASNSYIYGDAGTNGNMDFSGDAPKVMGDGQAVGTIKDGYVAGTETEGAAPVPMPDVACPSIPYGPTPSGPGYSFDAGNGKLSIGGPVTFNSGTYFFSELSKSGGDYITIPAGANVQIYISNKMSMSGGGFTNLNGSADSLQVWGCGTGTGGFTITGGQTVWMTVYAPRQKVKFTGGGDKHGSFIGYEWENSGPGSVYYDSSLMTGGGTADVVAVRGSWGEIF